MPRTHTFGVGASINYVHRLHAIILVSKTVGSAIFAVHAHFARAFAKTVPAGTCDCEPGGGVLARSRSFSLAHELCRWCACTVPTQSQSLK